MKKILILDESGTINTSYRDEKFFVLGGFVFNQKDLDLINEKLSPNLSRIKSFFSINEIKSSKLKSSKYENNLQTGYLIGIIDSIQEINPILYILVKENFDPGFYYKHKRSFLYNKLIEFLLVDLLKNKIISETDEITIISDNLNLNHDESLNFQNWLPRKFPFVVDVKQGNSQIHDLLQIADVISGLPKLKSNNYRNLSKDFTLSLLSRLFIHVYPQRKRNNFFKE